LSTFCGDRLLRHWDAHRHDAAGALQGGTNDLGDVDEIEPQLDRD
jgi:hypothetical protein